MRMRRTAQVAVAIAAGAALGLPGAGEAAVALTKTRARAVAVDVARRTCAVTPWCRSARVERARLCRRQSSRTVYCDVRFVSIDGLSSSGVVAVTRRRDGRLELGMAVPSAPSTVAGGAGG